MKTRLLLLLVLIVTVGNAKAATTFVVENLSYETINDETCRVVGHDADALTVDIPESVIYEEHTYRVTEIGEEAFLTSKLTSVTISNSITLIGEAAFANSPALTSVIIPASVVEIGKEAFLFCRGLTSLTISEGVGLIGEKAFGSCVGLTSIVIPSSVTSIGIGAFSSCSYLTSVTISDGVMEIANIAFALCDKLTSIALPASITSIAGNAFASCSTLNSIEVSSDSESYSSLDGILFDKLQTTLLIYPAGKRNRSYTVPNTVTAIGANAFGDCAYLTSVTISGNVTTIGQEAFSNCLDLNDIYCLAQTPPAISQTTFDRYSATLHIPAGCKSVYEVADYWKKFTKVVEEGESAIDNIDVESSINYYAGILSLRGNDTLATVYAYTQDGKCVLICPMAGGQEECDLSSLAKGIYLVQVRTGNETNCLKIVK